MVAIALRFNVCRSRCNRTPIIASAAQAHSAPVRNRSTRNERGGICSRTALVAGNVAPQIRVVSSRASWGMGLEVLSHQCVKWEAAGYESQHSTLSYGLH